MAEYKPKAQKTPDFLVAPNVLPQFDAGIDVDQATLAGRDIEVLSVDDGWSGKFENPLGNVLQGEFGLLFAGT